MNDTELEDRKDFGEKPGHILICGWSAQGRRAVDDLLTTAPLLSLTIIARIGDDPTTADIPENDSRITHLQTDPTTRQGLFDAGIDDADVVVLLADRCRSANPETLDARTILTCLTIREVDDDVHVIAELTGEDNRDLAVDAGVDETILADRFSGVMLSQSLQSTGLSELFTRLFETGAGAMFDETSVPPSMVGALYSQAVAQSPKQSLGAVAGLRRDGELHLPPTEDLPLRADDMLLLIHRV